MRIRETLILPSTSRSISAAGQALAEFAIVVPLIVLFMVAAVDVGRGVFAYNSITNAVREGARMAIVNQDVNAITERATSQAAVADQDASSVTVHFYEATSDGVPDTTQPCATPVPVGCLAVVTYQTNFRPVTPIIANILWPSGVTLEATSILPVEYTCPNGDTLPEASCPKQP